MSYDWILYAIVAAFTGWEGIAHYALHNQQGHTLSNRIAWLENHGPPALRYGIRVLVACAVAALGVHLEGLIP